MNRQTDSSHSYVRASDDCEFRLSPVGALQLPRRSIAPRATPRRTLFDRNRPLHALLPVTIYRTIDLVSSGFEGDFEFGTLTGGQVFAWVVLPVQGRKHT